MDVEVETRVTSLALKAFAPHPDFAVVVQPGGVLLAPAFVLKLAAKGSYASIPAIPAYNPGTSDLTVEAWFCSAQGGPLVTLASAAAPVFAIAIDPNGDIVVSEAGTRVASIGQPSTALNSQWHHVAVSRASGVLAIYLDGVQQATATETTRFAISGATQLQFGAAVGQATSLVGNFAEVRLWNTARTQAQILASMFYRQATPTGLIGCWTFTAQSLVDSSPNQNNGGSLTGQASYTFVPISFQPAIGTLVLNGETPLVAIGGTPDYNFGTGDFTIEAWLATLTAGPLMQRGAASSGAAGFQIGCDSDNTLWATLCDGATTQTVRSLQPLPGLIGGGARHIALTRSGTLATLYVNGVMAGSATSNAAVSIDVAVTVPLSLGNTQPFVNGPAARPPRSPGAPPPPPGAVVTYGLQVSELRLWSNARTQEQLYRGMLIESHGDEPGLAGYWNFATGNVVDRSTRRNFSVAPYTATISPNTLDLVLPQYVLSLPGGPSSYMAVPSNTGFDFGTGDFTIEMQFLSTAPGTLLSRSPERTSPSCGYMVAVTAAALTLTLDNGRSPQTYTAPITLLDGKWHHVAWCRKAGVISAFADAMIVASSPAASAHNLVSPVPLVVGANYDATANSYSAGLGGSIDFVSLWPFARPLADLQRATYRAVEGTVVSAVGAWSFDQQAPIDQSMAGANGVLGSAASIVAEYGLAATVPLSSLAFSGTQSALDASARTDLSFGGSAPYTIAAWVRTTAANATGTIVGRFDTAGGASEFRLRLVNGVPVAERAVSGGIVTGATRLSAGYWYFVSMTYDGTTLSVAVNGNTEARAATGSITAAPATPVRIGASSAATAASDSLACGIQTVQIWKQALSPLALLDAVRANPTGIEPNLQAYFSFVFGTTRDWTGHGPDAVLSAAYFQASTIGEQPIHYARALAGGGGYIDCGGGRSLNLTTAMTLEAWIRIDAFTEPNQVIMAKGAVYQIRRYGTTNQISFSTAGLQPVAAAELPSLSTVSLIDGAWHHVCAVYDGSTKKLYIDGALNASVAAVGSLATGNGVLYVADNDGEVLVLDQETGDELWNARTFKAITTSPVVDKNVMCVSSPTGNIFAFDTDKQTRLWDAQIPSGYQVPLRIHRDQILYSGAGTAISAIDLQSGAPAWNLRGLANDAAPTVYANNTALFCANYSVFSREITTTRLNWAYNLPDKALAAPAVDLNRAFINCGDNNVYALSLDGVVGRASSYQATAALIDAPKIHDHTIYIAAADGTITALTYAAGAFTQLWTVSLGTTLAQPIVVAAPFVAAVGADNVLRVFNAVSGAVVWTWSRASNGVNLTLTGLTVVNGAAYLSLSSEIYLALDIVNQKILWEKSIQTVAVAGAAITYAPFCIGASVSAKGVVAPGTFDGLVAEVRLWSQARTADEIALSFDRRMVGDEAWLAGYWSCSSAGAGFEQDLSGNLNPGTVVGTVPACEVDFSLKDPTPRLVAQSRMMQDWSAADVSGGNANGTVVFRTEVSFLDGNARPLLGARVRLWTDEPTTIVANGVSYNSDNANAAITTTDARGMITVLTPCNALTTPTLQLWADYMADNERVIIHPDTNLTETLANISGSDILNPGASSNPLLRDKTTLFPSLTQAQADGIASAVSNAIQTVKKPTVNQSRRRISLEAMLSGTAAAPGSGGAVSSVIELAGSDQYARYVGAGSLPHWKFDFSSCAFTPMTQMDVDAHLAALAPRGMIATTELGGTSLWDDFVNGIKRVANVVITLVGKAVQLVVSWVQSGIQALTHIFQSVAEVGQALFGIFKQLLDTVVDAAKKIYRFFAFLFDWDDILVTKNALVQNVRDVFGQVNAKIDWVITQEQAFFDDIEGRVDNSFKTLIGLLGKQNLTMINGAAPSLQPMLPGASGGINASLTARRFAALDQQRGAYGVEGNWLMSTSLSNSSGITGGAVSGYDADAFGSLAQVFQQIYSMIQGGKAIAAFRNAEACFRQIGTNPESLLQLTLQGVLEALRGLADLAIEICKVVTTLLLKALKGFFALLLSAMTAPIEIPVVSWLYGEISGGAALSVLDLMALVVAIPTTVIYKAFAGTAPFAPPQHAFAEVAVATNGLTPAQKGLKTAGAVAQLLNIPLMILADLQAVVPPVPSETSSLIPKPFPPRLKDMFTTVDVKRIGPSLGPNLLRWVSFGLQTFGYTTSAPWIYSATPTPYDLINWLFGAAEFIVVQGAFAVMASITGEVWAVSWMIPCVIGCLRLVIWLVTLIIAFFGGTALDPAKVASGFFSPLPAAAKFLRKPELVASSEGISLAILVVVDIVAGGIPPAITLGTTWA